VVLRHKTAAHICAASGSIHPGISRWQRSDANAGASHRREMAYRAWCCVAPGRSRASWRGMVWHQKHSIALRVSQDSTLSFSRTSFSSSSPHLHVIVHLISPPLLLSTPQTSFFACTCSLCLRSGWIMVISRKRHRVIGISISRRNVFSMCRWWRSCGRIIHARKGMRAALAASLALWHRARNMASSR